MTRIQKLKSIFIKNEFYLWRNFVIESKIAFTELTDDVLLDIAQHLKSSLFSVQKIGSKRYRLTPEAASSHNSIDELLISISKIIAQDYADTFEQSKQNGYNFSYFLDHQANCESMLKICNALRNNHNPKSNCVYPLVTIQKFGAKYLMWNHIENFVCYLDADARIQDNFKI